jgi:hypothetical protein
LTLPIEDTRPGDEVYPRVKEKLEFLKNGVAETQSKVTELVLQDMMTDLALAQSVDEIGEVIEYLIQDLGIERPTFDADMLLRNLRRITQLCTSYKMTQLFEMPEEMQSSILKAEMERLWFDPNRPAPVTNVKLSGPVETKLPVELNQMLAAITRVVSKK